MYTAVGRGARNMSLHVERCIQCNYEFKCVEWEQGCCERCGLKYDWEYVSDNSGSYQQVSIDWYRKYLVKKFYSLLEK